MAIGMSTYAYFWRASERMPAPMTVEAMLADTATLGGSVLQLCDVPWLAEAADERLDEIRSAAAAHGVALEVGTRGTDPAHLRRFVAIATRLGATLLRSMWTDGDDRPDRDETLRRLREILPELRAAGVTLALETYEQVPTEQLCSVVEELDDPLVGICLDPANSVAAFERPDDVVDRCAPRTVNWHVKDFAFSRNPGWVGFVYSGTALGDGAFDYERALAVVKPEERGINRIVEFWLPWRDDVPEAMQAAATAQTEADWARTTMETLRRSTNV